VAIQKKKPVIARLEEPRQSHSKALHREMVNGKYCHTEILSYCSTARLPTDGSSLKVKKEGEDYSKIHP